MFLGSSKFVYFSQMSCFHVSHIWDGSTHDAFEKIFFFYTYHHRSRARLYSRRGCENNRRDKTAHKPHLTQISQVSTDAGLKGIEIKFSRKHRRWERIP